MCTAISIKSGNNYYFGRTLDVCASYGERVVITPRTAVLKFKKADKLSRHYAIIGMAHVSEEFPLYYDGMNEKGLCMAGLNFPSNAVYHKVQSGKLNLASFELIPFVLGTCRNLDEARTLLKTVSVADINFSESMPHTPLHWMIGDKSGEIVVESVEDGLKIYENPVGVMTNNPPFETQLFNLKNYAHLSTKNPANTFSKRLDLTPYSRGMGALGLPGDWSSPSRFVRATFVKEQYKKANVNDFFHVLDSVAVPKHCVWVDGDFQYTVYSSCCDAEKRAYYFKTYDNPQCVCTVLDDKIMDLDKLIF